MCCAENLDFILLPKEHQQRLWVKGCSPETFAKWRRNRSKRNHGGKAHGSPYICIMHTLIIMKILDVSKASETVR